MSQYSSGFADYVEKFVAYRKASGSWNETSYGLNIKLFDHYCADNFPKQELSQKWLIYGVRSVKQRVIVLAL